MADGAGSRRERMSDEQRQKTRETQDFRLLNVSENSRANHVASGHHRIVVVTSLFINYLESSSLLSFCF